MADRDMVDPMGANDPSLVSPTNPAENGEIPKMDLERTLPRQVSSGYYRGIQTISGQLIIADPTTSNPVITLSGVDQNQVFSDPKTKINQILIGNLGNGIYGMKVAETGTDVLSATDDQLIFNSGQNVFKIVQTGTIDFGSSSDNVTSTFVLHNLGYKPVALVYLDDGVAAEPLPISTTTGLDTVNNVVQFREYFTYDTTTTKLEIVAYNALGSDGLVYPFKYYLLQESAS